MSKLGEWGRKSQSGGTYRDPNAVLVKVEQRENQRQMQVNLVVAFQNERLHQQQRPARQARA